VYVCGGVGIQACVRGEVGGGLAWIIWVEEVAAGGGFSSLCAR